MNFLVAIRRTTLITLCLSYCFSAKPIDIRISRLIKRIFYIPPSGETYFNASVQHAVSAESNNCLSGVCVPIHLCVNGNVVTSGANLLGPRIRSEDDIGESRSCSKAEKCCKLSLYDDSNVNLNQEFNVEFDEISKITLDGLDDTDNDIDYTDSWHPKCGIRNFNILQPRISGEDKAREMEFPWMVMVMLKMPKSDVYDYRCGGSLIHPSAVLTAAHCVVTINPKFIYIRAGEWNMANSDETLPHQDREIQSVVIHREFLKTILLNDIAVLILKTPLEFAVNVNTICLPPPNYSSDNALCLVTGWGKNYKGRLGKFQTILKKVELPIIPNDQCQRMFRKTILGRHFRLDSSFICAGGEFGRDTCDGDGGSPLVCKIPNTTNRYYQSGIVSWGIGCNQSNIP